MLRRIFGILLVCVLMVSLIPTYARAETTQSAESEEIAAWNKERAAILNADQTDDGTLAALLDSPHLSGASARDIGSNEFYESELNNSIHAANLMYRDYTIYGSLENYDRDYYVFELSKASEITVISISSTENTAFVLYDSEGEAILGVGIDLGTDETGLYYDAYVCDLVAGTYYLVFTETNADYSEYVFYFDHTAISGSHSHSYYPTVYDPDCESEGYTVYNCSCGRTYTDDRVAALGHDIDPDSYWFYGTDTNVMQHRSDCNRCSSSILEPCDLVASGITDATIAQLGKTRYTCTKCTASRTDYIPYRIFGETRYETSFEIADALKESLGVEKFDTILIALGTEFADAMSGSYLAAVKNAPILLYSNKYVGALQEYIAGTLAEDGTVYLLGGPNALPTTLETTLKDFNVKRLWGKTRYETNLEILKEAGVADQEILVCTGTGFADSLSASATGKPILLVSSSLTADQKAFLQESSSKIVIIGGPNAISAALEAELKTYGSVERLNGATRYATSVLVADRFFEDPNTAILAYSMRFPDGLCGGPLAFSMNAPMILTATGNETAAAEYAKNTGIVKGAVLGGTILISDETVLNIIDFGEPAE